MYFMFYTSISYIYTSNSCIYTPPFHVFLSKYFSQSLVWLLTEPNRKPTN
ncbi:hypothetical protein HanRHA438_Chr08g0363421 [Helianthus annuus]|nr:hypothetical protein HanRHA438_Chr08g0363421 [Helianthus annuus]